MSYVSEAAQFTQSPTRQRSSCIGAIIVWQFRFRRLLCRPAPCRTERLITRSMLLPALECAQKPRTLQQCCFVEASCCSNVKECCIARVRRCRCLGTVMDVICLFASAAGLAVAEIRAGSRRDGHADKGRAHVGRIFSKGLLRTTRRDIRGHDSGVAKGRHHNTP